VVNYQAMSTDDLWDYVEQHPQEMEARFALLDRMSDEHTDEVQLIRQHLRSGRIAHVDALRVVMDFEIDWAMVTEAPDEQATREIFLADIEED